MSLIRIRGVPLQKLPLGSMLSGDFRKRPGGVIDPLFGHLGGVIDPL